MQLIIEPEDNAAPLLNAIRLAKKSVEIAVFRFDRSDVESALKEAVSNGVKVTTLIASENRDGEEDLRRLEMRFLDAGITVARSASDLLRYHGKLLIIDRRILYLLSFNWTYRDIEESRGFGIITRSARLVQEAVRLFEADCTRMPYTPAMNSFVVSPANSRKVLGSFLKRAKQQLLIYDPEISDGEMIRILQDRAKAGVEIRIIGQIDERAHLPAVKHTAMRLHARTIIRDRRQAFVGSQSLRPVELDFRREVGLIIRDDKVVPALIGTFEADWSSIDGAKTAEGVGDEPLEIRLNGAEIAMQVLEKELPSLTTTVKEVVKRVVAEAGREVLEDSAIKGTVKKAVKRTVKEAVREVAEEVAEGTFGEEEEK